MGGSFFVLPSPAKGVITKMSPLAYLSGILKTHLEEAN